MLLTGPLMGGPAAAATLDIVVGNIRNGTGDIRVAVCSRAQFLNESCEYVAVAPAQPGEVRVHLENVAPGTWAVQAFHDEDGDGRIGTNLLGLPTEGLGFSNDARFRFGPPPFDDAAFRLNPAGGRVRVPLRYSF